ncbi:uncharacterized protein LOC116412824 [Galleria mellonella]|uniref:Uncharacterized protein LOC116412824 n=1 Tax=Galleria mellonella TaxID=7137 RepID=A0A6J3BWS2_GALME|nr:uncharacterized protein LOC116412824 [Galleria mellonella]
MADNVYSTPVNTITRETLTVLITNNVMNESLEFNSDCEEMETESPIRKPNLRPISKKLFHSPLSEHNSNEDTFTRRNNDQSKRCRKRKQNLIPDSCKKIKKAHITECNRSGYSPETSGGMRKKVLISLFYNKEYSMDVDSPS